MANMEGTMALFEDAIASSYLLAVVVASCWNP